MTFRLRHLAAALLLHVALVGLLIGGAQCSAKPVRPPPIQGVLLDPSRQETAAQKKRAAEELARKRKEEAEKKKREEEAEKKKQEEEKQKAEEQKKQQALAQQKKAADDLKQKQAADAKKRKEDAEKKKRDDALEKKKAEDTNKKKKQDEEKEKQLTEQRELQDKARLEDEMRQEAVRRDADREANALAEGARAEKQSEWAAQLGRAIERKWNRPASVTQDFSCTVHVLLLPDGSVDSANIVKSCGNPSLDRSVESAALRASPLPKPADPSIFDRDLIIIFQPGNQQQ